MITKDLLNKFPTGWEMCWQPMMLMMVRDEFKRNLWTFLLKPMIVFSHLVLLSLTLRIWPDQDLWVKLYPDLLLFCLLLNLPSNSRHHFFPYVLNSSSVEKNCKFRCSICRCCHPNVRKIANFPDSQMGANEGVAGQGNDQGLSVLSSFLAHSASD